MNAKKSWAHGICVALVRMLIFLCILTACGQFSNEVSAARWGFSKPQIEVSSISEPAYGVKESAPTSAKNGEGFPSSISVDHHFPFSFLGLVLALVGGFIVCFVVGLIVGIILTKRISWGAEKRGTASEKRPVYPQRGHWNGRSRQTEPYPSKATDVNELRTEIHQQFRELKEILAAGKDRNVQEELIQKQPRREFRGEPSTQKVRLGKVIRQRIGNKDELIEAYNEAIGNSHEQDNFLKVWECKMADTSRKDAYSDNIMLEVENTGRASFLLVDIEGSTYVLPVFFSIFDTERIQVLKRCFQLEIPEGKQDVTWEVISPATANNMGGNYSLKEKGVISTFEGAGGLRRQQKQEIEDALMDSPVQFDIKQITVDYNKALRFKPLRVRFSERHPEPVHFSDRKFFVFPEDRNRGWLFPAFNEIISGNRISDNLRKAFEFSKAIVEGGTGDIEIEPAMYRHVDNKMKIEQRGTIMLKRDRRL